MNKLDKLLRLNEILLCEAPCYREQAREFSKSFSSQWKLFRSLVNIRKASAAGEEFLSLQDELLQQMIAEKGVTDLSELTPVRGNIYLWQGDITTLRCDGIVNAANSRMTGCYIPCHGCIDNAIHTFAGVQLRLECAEIMEKQGFSEPAGQAKITGAYNLPGRYVLHTVGPIVSGKLTKRDCALLKSCYESCLKLAKAQGLESLAFCCISTGEFHFPKGKAAEIAVETVSEYLRTENMKVIFNVFSEEDYKIYRDLLK